MGCQRGGTVYEHVPPVIRIHLVQATGQSMEAKSQADNVPGSVLDKPKETSATEMSHHHQIENQLSSSDRSQEDEAALAAILGEASGKDALGSDESYNF